MLRLFAELVQGVAATLGMRNRRQARDWHTNPAPEALPHAKPDTQLKETHSTHGVIPGLAPGISVGPTRGLAVDPHEALNRNARHKAEHDSVVVALPKVPTAFQVVIPETRFQRAGNDTALSGLLSTSAPA